MKVHFEKVTRPADRSFNVHAYAGRPFGAPYHLHPEIELTAITRGHGTLIIGDHYGRFSAGDVILHGACLPHSYRGDPGSGAATVFVQFDPDSFGDVFWTLPENAPVRRLFARAGRGLRLSSAVAADLIVRLEALRVAPTGRPTRLAALLEILDLAARDNSAVPLASAGYASPKGAAGLATIDRILRAVDRGWRDDIRLPEVARQAGMHPQSLSRFCRRRLGRGFSDLVVARRLAEVARRLLETDDGIAEAAFACGFNNLSNFNRLFRRAYACSPRAYRARAG